MKRNIAHTPLTKVTPKDLYLSQGIEFVVFVSFLGEKRLLKTKQILHYRLYYLCGV